MHIKNGHKRITDPKHSITRLKKKKNTYWNIYIGAPMLLFRTILIRTQLCDTVTWRRKKTHYNPSKKQGGKNIYFSSNLTYTWWPSWGPLQTRSHCLTAAWFWPEWPSLPASREGELLTNKEVSLFKVAQVSLF